jgi:hypothetical protein
MPVQYGIVVVTRVPGGLCSICGEQGAVKTHELVVYNGDLRFTGVHPSVFMWLCTAHALHMGHGVVHWCCPRADWFSRNTFRRPCRSSPCFTLGTVTRYWDSTWLQTRTVFCFVGYCVVQSVAEDIGVVRQVDE